MTSVPGEPKLAYCKACKSELTARKKDLSDHEKSRKHKGFFEKYAAQLNQVFTEEYQQDVCITFLIFILRVVFIIINIIAKNSH